jgi:hypothetical protein
MVPVELRHLRYFIAVAEEGSLSVAAQASYLATLIEPPDPSPAKGKFAFGFLTGQEMDWLPEAMRILHACKI